MNKNIAIIAGTLSDAQEFVDENGQPSCEYFYIGDPKNALWRAWDDYVILNTAIELPKYFSCVLAVQVRLTNPDNIC